ncbi:hypothetical protein DER45DRAFT_22842 [Fusarium avenaceum]|nr:hypothetical protein DER45DRAFT_22842 [Fusarium avenaceum]
MYTRVTLIFLFLCSLLPSSSPSPSFSCPCPWPCFFSIKKKQRSPGGHLLASLFLVFIFFLVLHSRSLGNQSLVHIVPILCLSVLAALSSSSQYTNQL